MRKTKALQIGLIGLGGMSNAHRMMISELDFLSLYAVCDVNPALTDQVGDAERVAKEKRYQDMEKLIADPSVDAVISAVPNVLHARVIELCIQYQKPFLAEKPFTLNLAEAEKLAALYEKTPVPCMTGFSYRYVPSFRYAKQLIKENKIGPLRHMTVRYLQSFGAPLCQTPHSWRFEKAVSGTGVLADLGAHMVDSARFFAGEFLFVSALTKTFVKERKDPVHQKMKPVDVDDYVAFQAVMQNGVIGQFVATRNAVGSNNQHDLTLYGDWGTLSINCEQPNKVDLCLQEKKGTAPVFQTIHVPNSYKKQQLADFAELIAGFSPDDAPTFYDGYKNQEVLEKLWESARKSLTCTL